MARMLAGLGWDFEVIAPDALRDEVLALSERLRVSAGAWRWRPRRLTGRMGFTPMPAELETERFVLTREELADASWLADLFTSRGGGTVTVAQARSRVAAMHDLTRAHGIGAYVLRPRDAGAPAGYAAIVIGRGTVEEPEIAYELLPGARGHGYATEAASVVLQAAFATGRGRIWATIRPWNAASLRVLDKLGGFREVRTTSDDQGPILWFASERPVDPPTL